MEQFLAAHADAIGAVIATVMVFLMARVPAWITGKSTLGKIAQSAWRQFMARYSTVQPKDAMGTFKKVGEDPAPAATPAPVVDTEAPTDPGHGSAGPKVLVLLFASLSLFGSGCSHGTSTAAKKTVATVIDCGLKMLKEAASRVLPDLLQIVMAQQGGLDSQVQLEQLGIKFGADAVMCASAELRRDITETRGRSLPPIAATAVARIDEYLYSQRPKVAKVEGSD